MSDAYLKIRNLDEIWANDDKVIEYLVAHYAKEVKRLPLQILGYLTTRKDEKKLKRKYKNYDIKQLESNFRSIMCLKNRFGDCDVEVGVNFFGSINLFHELPAHDEIYDYARYTNPNYLLEDSAELDKPIELDNTINIDNDSNFNYML